MQIGVFSVSDITQDPTNGRVPTEGERIANLVAIAQTAEDAGLDVFAVGEHHNPPFVSSSPTTTLAYIAALTSEIMLSTAITLITTNDPVKIAEDFAMLQHLSKGRVDLMLGRGNTAPVYPWFGKDIRKGIDIAAENYGLLHRLWHEDVVDWEGQYRVPLQQFTSVPRPLDGIAPFVWHGSIRSRETADMAATYGDGFFHNNIFWDLDHTAHMIAFYRECWEEHGQGRADQAIVGIGAQAYMAANSQDAVREFRPYFDNAPVYGHGPSLEEFSSLTPLTVGSPQQVIERYAAMRERFGDVQRIMFLIDHAGLPLAKVLNQIEILGGIVAPALREAYDSKRPDDVPDAPTHADRVAQRDARLEASDETWDDLYRFHTGDNWTGLRAEDSKPE